MVSMVPYDPSWFTIIDYLLLFIDLGATNTLDPDRSNLEMDPSLFYKPWN